MSDDVLAGLVPPHIESLAPYQPGKPVEELERELGIHGAIKLASNENPLGPSPRALAAIRDALDGSNRYPDGGGYRLRAALSEKLGVPPGMLVLGAGSNELIDLLVRVFCRPGEDHVLTHRYAFFMVRVACHAAGVELREIDVGDHLCCDGGALADAISPRTKLIYLPNPNNPTGAYLGRGAFERLLERVPPRVLLVVDEAYQEYAEHIPDYPIAERYRTPERPLLVTLRTFSKIYGLASLRVGYGIAHPRVVGYLNRVRLPFNVGTLAQEGARAALGDLEHVETSRAANAQGLAQLSRGFARLPVRAFPSAGNFILVDLERDAMPVYQALLRRGVIVRPLAPAGLVTHVRISVGTPAENERALAALGEVLRG